MRVAWLSSNGRQSGRVWRLGRRVRRVATGAGTLALAVPLAWPSGAGGQHVGVPSASSVRAGVVRLAAWVTGDTAPGPSVPAQQSGTAAGKAHLVPESQTSGLKHVTGHAPGKAPGQVPAWAPHPPAFPKSGKPAPGPVRGFDPATSTLVGSGATANSKLYKNADGSYTRKLWPDAVNYKTSAGGWTAIDNTLVAGPANRWRNKANSLAESFAPGGADPVLASVASADGSQQVSYSLAGAAAVPGVASGLSVTYPGVLADTDATETATADGISEALTLHSAAAGTSWVFPLALKGLTASLNGGEVDLTDASGKVAWVIPPAVATSGPADPVVPGLQASSQLTYQLVTYNGGLALQMNLDPAWLDAPGREFPVTIDPTVAKEDVQGSSYAQMLNGVAQTGAHPTAGSLPSGTTTTSSGTFKDISYLDFSELGANLPDEHITAATLNLFDIFASQCTTSETEDAYRVTGAWSPSSSLTYPGPGYNGIDATWTGKAAADACSNGTGQFGQGGWISMTVNGAGLAALNSWTTGGTNFGFAIASSQTDANAYKVFDSHAQSNVAATAGGDCVGDCRPYLSVTYTADLPPQVDSQFPMDNTNVASLTPELIASGHDPDNWPSPVQYQFTVYDSSQAQVAQSPLVSSGVWQVPSGDLAWGQTYFWTVQAYDGVDFSPTPQVSYFRPEVPQPLVTSQLSQNPAGPGFSSQYGNWTTSATDANVATAGPALEITRDYNSNDPRLSGAFGAGWSSVLDMKVSSGQDGGSGTDTEVVTYPDGEEIGFGLNADGSYSPPPGRYAVLKAVAGGFTLTDKNDTVYTFAQPLGSGAYGLTSVADALGRTETFTYGSGHITTVTSASGRALTVSWTTPSGAGYPHVSSVVTPDATAGNASTAQTWTYTYSGDQLSTACPPASTIACTGYSYTSGSVYPDAVLDTGPHSYWRMDDTSGNVAASSVLANEGTDAASYSGAGLGLDAGPLAGSPATAASFDGSASVVTLPSKLVSGATYQTISLWFKTTATDGVLFSYQASPITAGQTTAQYVPTIYIGSDGKLNAQYWNGTAAPITSPSPVDDGQWHQVTLSAAANTQTLYLDGNQVGAPLSGTIDVAGMANNYVGTGFVGRNWPDQPNFGSSTAFPMFFNGDISDVAFWTRQLSGAEAQQLYSVGTHPASLLTKLTRPSGSVFAQVSYDPLTARVTSDTDSNGGTWQVASPTVSGSSQVYAGSVLQGWPDDYYRLNDVVGSDQATDQVDYYCGCGSPATYYNVDAGLSGGPFADASVASFNGSSSFLDVPVSDSASGGPGSVGVWFETTGTSEVLYSEQSGPVTGPAPAAYNPVLYIGQDGKLNGEFYDGNTTTAVSHAAVNDGQWHYAVLAAGATSQSLYVDGQLQATITGSAAAEPWTNVAAGAGFTGGNWPDQPSTTVTARWFNGDMAELAWYSYQLSAGQVSRQWRASQDAAGTVPEQVGNVTDPGGHTLTWNYDMVNDDRLASYTNAEGETTSYGYDENGFQDSVQDPNLHVVSTGYDARGNVISRSTCQDQQNQLCSTSYWTYYPSGNQSQITAPDARNDLMLTASDGRSASAGDTTYQTQYSYDPAGDLTGVTSPPVAGHPSGRTTSYAYTDGSSSTGGYQGAVPPKGLLYQVTTPGGAVTTTLYYADSDVAQVTGPDGQRTVYTYDGLGRKASQIVYSDTYPGGLVTSYTYDANGDLAVQTDPAVTDRVTGAVHTAQATTSYDPDGNVTSQTAADLTGGDSSRTTTRTYNAYDELASVTDPANATTAYTYDGYGNKASQTDPDGNVTDYTWDGDGHLLTATLENYTGSPPGSQAAAPLTEQSRAYDPAGRLSTVTDAMGNLTNYYYTDNNLLDGIVVAPGDWSQNFTTEWDSYDAAGNLIEKWTNNGATDTTYDVDAAGRVTQQVLDPSDLDRSTTVSYTPDDRQAAVTDSGPDGVSQTTAYTYDPAGNMLSKTLTDPGAGGPEAWFALSQTSGTAVSDQAAGGQPAMASNVTWDGSEAGFSGTAGSQIAAAGPVADTTGSFTVTAWANVEGATGGNQAVASQAAGTNSGFTLRYDPGTGNWEFARPLADTAGAPVAVAGSGANAAAATGTWAFLAGTYDANTGTMTLYVDGTAAGTATDVTPVAAHGPFTIGSAKSGGTQGEWFDGQAAMVQVYPRALPASDVGKLYVSSGDITTGSLTTTWTRDQRGLPTSMTSLDGAVTGYSYDEAGQLTETTAPPVTTQTYGNAPVTARPVTWTGYDTFGDVAEAKDPDGNVTTFGYDADGRQNSATLPPYTPPGGSPVTAVGTAAYDGDGLLTSTTDGLANTTGYGYDQLGDQVTVTAPDNSITTTAYDADREPLSVTTPTGAQTDSTWDYLGRQLTLTEVERDTGAGTAAYTTNYAYDDTAGGRLGHTASPDGVTSDIAYDAAGEITAVADGQGDTTHYGYDSLGRRTAVYYPDGTATATGYDAAGNVTSVSNLDSSGNVLASASAAFDGEGDQLSATDALGNSSTFTYDPTGMLTQELQPVSASSGITISFGYDAAGNETRYTDGNGSDWQYTYNPWGLPESRVEPATSAYSSPADSMFTTGYDADGDPVTETEPGGVTVTGTYNSLGELTGQSGTGADAATPARTFGYDADGNLTSAATSNTLSVGSNATSEAFTYDDRGLVLTATGSGGSTSYAYNGDGRVASVADAAGTTSYTYDGAGRLATLADPASGVTAAFSYNADSQVSGISYGSGDDRRSFGYDSQRRLVSDTLKTSSGAVAASQGYGYDADGRVTSQTTAGLAGPASSSYTYDQAGRLTSWDNGTVTTAYGYDGDGNLTKDGAKAYTYDARDELTGDGASTYSYTARGTPVSESSPSGSLAVSFDAYGDQAAAGTRSYTYDALGRLAADAPAAGGGGFGFSYVGATGTVASDGTTAYTWDPSGTSLFAAGAAGGGGGSLVLANAHGDVTGQFAAAGAAVSGSRAYDPWGAVTATAGTLTGQLGYQSAWTDSASGKDLMGARWYSPGAGDFTSADSVQVPPAPDPAAGSPFAYAAGDPLDLADPTGHRPVEGGGATVCSAGVAPALCLEGQSPGSSGTSAGAGSGIAGSTGALGQALINQARAQQAKLNQARAQQAQSEKDKQAQAFSAAMARIFALQQVQKLQKSQPKKQSRPVKVIDTVPHGTRGGGGGGGGGGTAGKKSGTRVTVRPRPPAAPTPGPSPRVAPDLAAEQPASLAEIMSEIAGLAGQVLRTPQAPDLGTGTETFPEGDQGPQILVNTPGEPGALILATPEAPGLGTGILKTPVSDQGPIINTSGSADLPAAEDEPSNPIEDTPTTEDAGTGAARFVVSSSGDVTDLTTEAGLRDLVHKLVAEGTEDANETVMNLRDLADTVGTEGDQLQQIIHPEGTIQPVSRPAPEFTTPTPGGVSLESAAVAVTLTVTAGYWVLKKMFR